LPLFIFINVFLGLTIGIWLASLTIRFRDFFHIIPYLISFGIWVTPVFYPTTILPLKYTYILYFNPLAGVIAGYRWTLLDMPAPSPYYLLSMLPVLLLFGAGVRFFIHTEQIIVDYL